jgi:hypothetical protein
MGTLGPPSDENACAHPQMVCITPNSRVRSTTFVLIVEASPSAPTTAMSTAMKISATIRR